MEDTEVADRGQPADDDGVPLEVLERRLTSRAAELAAAEAEWMSWLAEYDRRRGWAEWGCTGPAHWLSWKCGMSPSAARERVRVATALTELPLLRTEFAAGQLSYSKVQAITRVANEWNEEELVGLAVNATGAQLGRICAGYRSSMELSEADAFARRAFTKRRNHDGTTTYTLCVLDADTQRLDDHLRRAVDGLLDDAASSDASTSRRDAIAERGGIAALRADAAVLLLAGEAAAVEPTPTEVTLIVDAAEAELGRDDTCAQASGETLMVRSDGRSLPSGSGRRLLCDPRVQALVESADTGPLAVGRTTRVISRSMRRALKRRDNGACTFPGCHATRHPHAHHIVHWADGGPTELDNLVLVCHFHHHLGHEGGWSINRASRRFRRPDGTDIDPTPEHLRAGVGRVEPTRWPGAEVGPLEPPNMSPFDLPWTTAVLHHNEMIRRHETTNPAALNRASSQRSTGD